MTTHIQSLAPRPTTSKDDFTYFFPHYRRLYHTRSALFFLPHNDEDEKYTIPPPFQTYNHPSWDNWKKIWNAPPLILNPEFIPEPTLEFAFNHVLFRLQPPLIYFTAFHPTLKLLQGMTIVFKGYRSPHSRFVVEWCQWADEDNAYIKIVGVNSIGIPFPFSDPDYPTFILVIPLCYADVPIPSRIHSILLAPTIYIPSAYETEKDDP
jgi:hypothetical protein